MKKSTRRIAIVLLVIVLTAGIAVTVYANDYYRAVAVDAYLSSTESVTVTEIAEGTFFDGAGEDKALLFYPGGKVEETAYAPLLQSLAAQGIDCFLLKMPMKLAVFGMNKADSIIEQYPYSEYYLAGHSLGGAMAANYAAKNGGRLSGLFLLAAYPTEDMTDAAFPVVFLYGDRDGVVNREKLSDGFALAPANSERIEIKGGNHAYFGSYGSQKGDGTADITPEEQWQLTVDAILRTVNS
ncbi:MAG: alpha/beta hydrolase [Eubacterium sp.]|nr:alpha/beta hydrolase [Eubacterium sp.]